MLKGKVIDEEKWTIPLFNISVSQKKKVLERIR